MTYKALYRKYRPNTFEEVVGQQHIVATLLNAIKSEKLAHAYLFCGPRGTGKTSIAKLLAKTVNCVSDGERPCGECDNCRDIQESSHPDVIELDAATHTSVDDARDIIEKVKYAPMKGKYKVYIIDEVHMLSVNAFNALLKTLEEPPEYCIFILATTDPNKVLPTIVSRCQRFDFKKIAKTTIVARLKEICQKEDLNCSDEALTLIANLADGGMRDALSILDQCIAYAQNNISVEDVETIYGVATTEEKMRIFSLIKEKNSKGLIELLSNVSYKGIDIQRLTADLLTIIKDSVVYDYCKDIESLTVINQKQANEMLNMFDSTQLLTYADYLINIQSKYKDATNTLSYLEVCLLKMMNYQPQVHYINVEKPVVEEKKKKIVINEPKEEKNIFSANNNVNNDYTDEEYYQILIRATKPIKEVDYQKLANMNIDSYDQISKNILDIIKHSKIMASAEDFIIFEVEDRATANLLNKQGNKDLVEKALLEKCGIKKKISTVTTDLSEYLVIYYKQRKRQDRERQEIKELQKADANNVNVKEKVAELFGEGNFDVVEE